MQKLKERSCSLADRSLLSARLQPGQDPDIVIGEIVELLAALDEVGIPVHEEFIWLHFVDNLPPGYEFIKNNLQGSKEPLTRIALEDALRSRYNVQPGGKREGLLRILHCSCLARRLDGKLATVEVVVELTKASWTAGVEVRGFHRRRK